MLTLGFRGAGARQRRAQPLCCIRCRRRCSVSHRTRPQDNNPKDCFASVVHVPLRAEPFACCGTLCVRAVWAHRADLRQADSRWCRRRERRKTCLVILSVVMWAKVHPQPSIQSQGCKTLVRPYTFVVTRRQCVCFFHDIQSRVPVTGHTMTVKVSDLRENLVTMVRLR